MNMLICGSLAYDYIMDFPDSFKNHILPDQLHILSVSFIVQQLKKNYGGTAGNIAYSLALLGAKPLIRAGLGSDAGDFLAHFQKNGISTEYIEIHNDINTASAHITTDKDDNQITAFYPGPLNRTENLSIDAIKEPIALAIIGATDKDAMIMHAKECYEKKIPIVFDPGQQMTALSAQELSMIIGQATFLIANDYEMKLIEEKTGWTGKELLEHVEVVIETLGEKGSRISSNEGSINITSCTPRSVEDPTGAGDAYRAGFFVGYLKGEPLKTCGQMGSVAAAYAIEHYGTQNHAYTKDEYIKRYEDSYGTPIML